MNTLLRRVTRAAPSVEIHVPISPTPHYFTMIHYLAVSLEMNADFPGRWRLVVTVGGDEEPRDLASLLPWSSRHNIEWRWLRRELFRKHNYFGTAVERFTYSFGSDMVIMLDADIICTGSLRTLIARAWSTQRFLGMITHVSPWWASPAPEPTDDQNMWYWRRVFDSAALPLPPFDCVHTGWGWMDSRPEYRFCPPYFNLGVLVAASKLMRRVGGTIYAEMEAVNRAAESLYKCQIGLSLAVNRLSIPWAPLPVKYNYANVPDMYDKYRDEAAYVRLFHYLWGGEFDRSSDFHSWDTVDRLLRRDDLNEVNRLFMKHLKPVHEAVARDLDGSSIGTRQAAGVLDR